MSWLRVDDVFPRHRRVQALGRDVVAKWVHIVALCYCAEHLTDGLVDEIALRQIINDADVPVSAARRAVPRLVEVGLWLEHQERDGYLIRDYLDYNPTKEDVKWKREQARYRMQRVRANKQRTNSEVRDPSPSPSPVVLYPAVEKAVDNSLRSVNG